jgi:hypothetical protein
MAPVKRIGLVLGVVGAVALSAWLNRGPTMLAGLPAALYADTQHLAPSPVDSASPPNTEPRTAIPLADAASSVWFVDASTRQPLAQRVAVLPLQLPNSVASQPLSLAAAEAAAYGSAMLRESGFFANSLLPPAANAVLLRAAGYSQVLMPRAQLVGTIPMTRLARLTVQVAGAPGLVLPDKLRLLAEPVDPVDGTAVQTGFPSVAGRCSPVLEFAAEIAAEGPAEVTLEPGAYRVSLEGKETHPLWRCRSVLATAPGDVVLRCQVLPYLRVTVEAPTAPAIAWLRMVGGMETEVPFLPSGVAAILTADLADGEYRVGAVGDGWFATEANFVLQGGVPNPAAVALETRSAPVAHLVCRGAPLGARFEVATVQGGSAGAYLRANPDPGGLGQFAGPAGPCIVGVPQAPTDLLVVLVTGDLGVARGVTLQGPGTYELDYGQARPRTGVNIPEFVRAVVDRHGRRAVSFRVDAGVRFVGGRVVWRSVCSRDFLGGGPDPLASASWVCAVDTGVEEHRIVAEQVVGDRSQVLASTSVVWRAP